MFLKQYLTHFVPKATAALLLRFVLPASLLGFSCSARMHAQVVPATSAAPTFTSPLATGVRLDPVGDFIDLGSMPMGMALAPEGDKLAVVLSGWREQGL